MSSSGRFTFVLSRVLKGFQICALTPFGRSFSGIAMALAKQAHWFEFYGNDYLSLGSVALKVCDSDIRDPSRIYRDKY
jgi:hypothetical protein